MLRRVTLGAVSPARPRDLLGLDELVDGAVRLLLRQALRIRLGLLDLCATNTIIPKLV